MKTDSSAVLQSCIHLTHPDAMKTGAACSPKCENEVRRGCQWVLISGTSARRGGGRLGNVTKTFFLAAILWFYGGRERVF